MQFTQQSIAHAIDLKSQRFHNIHVFVLIWYIFLYHKRCRRHKQTSAWASDLRTVQPLVYWHLNSSAVASLACQAPAEVEHASAQHVAWICSEENQDGYIVS